MKVEKDEKDEMKVRVEIELVWTCAEEKSGYTNNMIMDMEL